MIRISGRITAHADRRRPRWALGLVAALSAAVLAGCAPSARTSGRLVIATFYPLYEFAQRIGGDRVTVLNLVPAGMEAHDYEPAPQDVVQLKRAALLVYNGAGLEPWLDRLLPEVPASVVRVNTTAGLALASREPFDSLPLAQGRQGNKGTREQSDRRRAADPHVWLDPVLAGHQVRQVLEGLVKADPDGRDAYGVNAARLEEDLQSLHEQFVRALASCARREFITSHAAFGYLAARYDLREIAVTGVSHEAEPSPARLVEVVRQARRTGARVIYTESLASPRIIEAVAKEVGARIRILNPIEGLTAEEQREGKTYFTVMHENLRNLAEGLDCRQ